MPQLIERTATEVVLTVILRNASGNPVAAVAHNAAGLSVVYRRPADSSAVAVTLAAGTAGVWSSGGWTHVGNGRYQLGLPNAAIVAGKRTVIGITYDGVYNDDAVDAVISTVLRPSVVVENAGAPVVQEGPTFSVTQRDDYEADEDVGPIGPITVETDLPLLREEDPPRLRFGATQRLGSRVGTVHAIGTAYAEAVDGEPNQYDLYIEITAEELNKPAGLYGWDIEAVFADDDVRTIVSGTMTIIPSWGDNETRDPLL
jgi:hypothetical protein